MREIDQVLLKQRAREEYDREKNAIERRLADLERRFQARIEAIGWLYSQEGNSDETQTHTQAQYVRKAVERCNLNFTRMDVEREIESVTHGDRPSRGTVIKELLDLEHSGLIRVMRPGRGRRATLYERLFTPSASVKSVDQPSAMNDIPF